MQKGTQVVSVNVCRESLNIYYGRYLIYVYSEISAVAGEPITLPNVLIVNIISAMAEGT